MKASGKSLKKLAWKNCFELVECISINKKQIVNDSTDIDRLVDFFVWFYFSHLIDAVVICVHNQTVSWTQQTENQKKHQ